MDVLCSRAPTFSPEKGREKKKDGRTHRHTNVNVQNEVGLPSRCVATNYLTVVIRRSCPSTFQMKGREGGCHRPPPLTGGSEVRDGSSLCDAKIWQFSVFSPT
ncbi:hypothetical protein CDAR_298101 [Caerostris darwini]|uniref:Uncharacterized protein n=1 Tax=Caerostris darwini TaxID=1538125 RepID=A0AAV4PY37_9ARAC|nr:hypothetical protein CDAR_298101 [Caerostris darwini]